MKTAIVIGASGLVGSFITLKLLDDNRYEKVKVFVRNSLDLKHPKLEEHIVNFEKLILWKDEIKGDELYSALGTTIKKAGSKEAQYKIDFTYQYEVAHAASQNGVKIYLLVSSAGANYKSGNFYLRIKGKLDEKVQLLSFKQIHIFRPSILVGLRSEKRLGESIGIKIAGTITKIIPALNKYRPIKASQVADAILKSANQNTKEKIKIYQPEEILKI
ncbi:MAG: NAD-dependent epimerase/dehydratase family protein [Ignavibacteriales bacterium]|nr:NAD-dependent epimerase/dehydratase family protein [Ignavibacteriales bacterium]